MVGCEQSTRFVNGIPSFVEEFGASGFMGEQVLGELLSYIGRLPGGAAKFSVSVFSNVVNVVTILIFTF